MNLISDYDYELPDELIARTPPERREDARLLVVDRANRSLEHRQIPDLPELLSPGDCLVLNDTQVVPARLLGYRTATGGAWEGLFLGTTEAGHWKLIGHTRGKLQSGEQITLQTAHGSGERETFQLTLLSRTADGEWTAEPEAGSSALEVLNAFGTVPLPPYLGKDLADETDWNRYQTVYAKEPGAVAAPTAGLHFTPELLQRCRERGIETATVTLHVGIGTFRPVSVEKLSDHQMHQEWCECPQETVDRVTECRTRGGRVVAVGTTSVRTLESAGLSGSLSAWRGETDLFIRPPFEFQVVSTMLTNFHLPKSTLLVLVSTFADRELIRAAYQTAIEQRYRFFSYGDAMLIL